MIRYKYHVHNPFHPHMFTPSMLIIRNASQLDTWRTRMEPRMMLEAFSIFPPFFSFFGLFFIFFYLSFFFANPDYSQTVLEAVRQHEEATMKKRKSRHSKQAQCSDIMLEEPTMSVWKHCKVCVQPQWLSAYCRFGNGRGEGGGRIFWHTFCTVN